MYLVALGLLRRRNAAVAWLGLMLAGVMLTGLHPAAAATSSSSLLAPILAQEGMSIGQAWPVLFTSLGVIESPNGQVHHCQALTGGGSVKLMSLSETKSTAKSTFNLYYEAGCTRLYVTVSSILAGVGSSSSNNPMETANSTAVYYGLKGQKLGTLELTGNVQFVGSSTSFSSIKTAGVGIYTPASAAPKVNLGLACTINLARDGAEPCEGLITQNFPSLNMALGSVTPLTLNLSTGGIVFANTPDKPTTLVTGPLNSLSVVQPTDFTLKIAGPTTSYGTTAVKGIVSSNDDLFPPPPVDWTVKDAVHHAAFSLAVTGPAGNSRATVTDTATGANLATLLVDKSGTGSITYTASGKHFAVSNWMLAD